MQTHVGKKKKLLTILKCSLEIQRDSHFELMHLNAAIFPVPGENTSQYFMQISKLASLQLAAVQKVAQFLQLSVSFENMKTNIYKKKT